jgi:hypothetical protein
MFLEIKRFADNESMKRHGIHHELFHMMATQTPGYVLYDPRWIGLNLSDFHYGESRSFNKQNPYNPGAPAVLGFVTDYAMMSVEEDKADMFACLMQEPNRKLIMRWAEKDSILARKIEAMKKFVVTYCPSMNESYWK